MYKLTMKDGSTHKADDVTEQGSFVVFTKGKKEIRVPTSDISKVETTNKSRVGAVLGSLVIMAVTGGAMF